MGNTVTLGGDRIGSGNKSKVHMHGFERSTHDLGYIWRSTMSAGTIVPFLVQVGLPGDTFDIDLGCDVKTHPTIGPLFGSMKVQLDVYQVPIRLYQGQLHNNKLGIGLDMNKVKLPQIFVESPDIEPRLKTPIDLQQINPSCILAYLGIRGLGRSGTRELVKRHFNAIPYLAYWDIFKNYYANKQEKYAYVIMPEPPPTPTWRAITTFGTNTVSYISTPVPLSGVKTIWIEGENLTPDSLEINVEDQSSSFHIKMISEMGQAYHVTDDGKMAQIFGVDPEIKQISEIKGNINATQGGIRLGAFELEQLDTVREDILSHTRSTMPFIIDKEYPFGPLGWVLGPGLAKYSQAGLAVKTYQSDLFNNWINTEWLNGDNGINAITAIDTTSGKFNIDTLILSRKVYDMLNRIAVSGGSYEDWITAVYDHNSSWRSESPMYMGGLIKELVFQEVISNSESSTTIDGSSTNTQPLGTLAGKGRMAEKHKGGSIYIKVDEPSYIIGLVSITPRIDYSQGNDWHINLQTMNDFHKPSLDQIGFQDLLTEQMAAWDTLHSSGGGYRQNSAGKQPAWINYMTNYNRTYGNFADERNEMFMTLNRRYEYDEVNEKIKDLTTYIDPVKFNYMFAQTSLDAQNYWVQIAADITARRKMSAKIIPNL